MPGPEVSLPWRRLAAWSTVLTVAAVLAMFAASGFGFEWLGFVALTGALAPAPLAYVIARRWLRGRASFAAAAVGLALGALVQVWLALLTVEQFLIVFMNINIFGTPAESLYGLAVLFAPLYVGPPLLVGLGVGAVLRLNPAAGRHSPR
jgi:hypothetical protein